MPHDNTNTKEQELDKAPTIDGNVPRGSESSQSNFANVNDSQAQIRHNVGIHQEGSTITTFDVVKDVMEVLRRKHTNLVSKLEVCFLLKKTTIFNLCLMSLSIQFVEIFFEEQKHYVSVLGYLSRFGIDT